MKVGKFDIEGNGLLESITEVHCLATSIEGERLLYIQKDVSAGLAKLDECDVIVAHFGIGFDLPALFKVLGWKPRAKVIDTLTLSCLLCADIDGGHSLDAWGERTGVPKTDYKAAYIEWRKQQPKQQDYVYTEGDEWVAYNPVMGTYCLQDVAVLDATYDALMAEKAKYPKWDQAILMEHRFAKDFALQGIRGVMVDQPHCLSLLDHIDGEMERIRAKVEPLLPPKPRGKGELDDATPPKVQFKKDGTPSKACLAWFDSVLQDVDGAWVGEKFGEKVRLPTPADAHGNRLPLSSHIAAKLSDQEHIKSWLMRGLPTQAAHLHYDKIYWRD